MTSLVTKVASHPFHILETYVSSSQKEAIEPDRLRSLFSTALRHETPSNTPFQVESARSVIALACSLDKGSSPDSCSGMLKAAFVNKMNSCPSLQSLQELCLSPGASVALDLQDDSVLSKMYKHVRTVFPNSQSLENLIAFFPLVKDHITKEALAKYDALALSILTQRLLVSSSFDLKSSIQQLRKAGLPLKNMEHIFYPRLQELSKAWTQKATALYKTFDTSSLDDQTLAIDDASIVLQKQFEADMRALQETIQGLPDEIVARVMQLAFQTQGNVLIDFSSAAISSCVTLLAKQTMSFEELKGTLIWVNKLVDDFACYQQSPLFQRSESLTNVIAKLTETKRSIEHSIETWDHTKNPSKWDRVCTTAGKAAQVATTIVSWLPFMITHVLPIAMAARAGHKAEGMRGALLTAGVATAGSLFAAYYTKIAEKATSELTKMPFLPNRFHQPVEAILRFAIHMQSIVFTMQLNCLIAGGVSAYTKGSEPQGLLNAGKAFGSSAYGVAAGVPKVLQKEFNILSSLLVSPKDSGEIVGRITNTLTAQMEACVATYELGHASIMLPQATLGIWNNLFHS